MTAPLLEKKKKASRPKKSQSVQLMMTSTVFITTAVTDPYFKQLSWWWQMRWSWFVREKTGSWKGKGDCHAAMWKWGRFKWHEDIIDYVQDRNKETASNKSGSSLLPKNVDCTVQDWVFVHSLHFDVCYSVFGHLILSEGVMHVLNTSLQLDGWEKNMMTVGTGWACCLFLTFYLPCSLNCAGLLVCLINGLLKWTSIGLNCIYLIDFRVKKTIVQVNKPFC